MDILSYIGYILLAVFVLLVMIMIHEFGHYLAGKLLGFKINEFSVGFGPKIFSKRRKSGELFCLRAIPLGGFCAFEGEDSVDDEQGTEGDDVFPEEKKGVIGIAGKITGTNNSVASDSNSNGYAVAGGLGVAGGASINGAIAATAGGKTLKRFNEQEPWKRIIVLLAGGMFNLISAVVFSFIFILVVGLPQPQIAQVAVDENLTGYVQLQQGDVITHIDGTATDLNYLFSGSLDGTSAESAFDIAFGRYYSLGSSITLTVRGEDGKVRTVEIERQLVARRDSTKPMKNADGSDVLDENGNKVGELVLDDDGEVIYDSLYGLSMSTHYSKSFSAAIKRCVPLTGKMAWLVLSTLGKLITGQLACNNVSGPVGTVVGIAENTRNYGISSLLLMLPLIAANLGVFNLLPIPALDGSKILFCIIEWIRKKPMNRKVEGMIHAIGLLVLFGLVILLDISGMFLRCGA